MDLTDAYSNFTLNQNLRKLVEFLWKGTLYDFIYIYFGPVPAPQVFTKLLKTPVSLQRKLIIGVIIYLGDKLNLIHTIKETYMNQNTVMYLLQDLGFVINTKKPILHLWQKLEFLGMEIHSIKMNLL